MNYEENKEKIFQLVLNDLLSLKQGEETTLSKVLVKYTTDSLGLYETFMLFHQLGSAVAAKGYVLSFNKEAQKDLPGMADRSVQVLKITEIPAVDTKAPMGWNSWDCYGASVTEEVVKQNAHYMAKYLKPYGYEYIVVDIEWAQPKNVGHMYEPFTDLCMDEYGRLIPAVNRFPSAANGAGFKPLADYVHNLGLKFGIHIMRGIPRAAVHKNLPVYGTNLTARQIAQSNSICMWNTDMYGVSAIDGGKAYYDSIFKLYAEWGVDFIKIDDICRELPHEKEELLIVSQALQDCGREMVLSLSPGPALIEEAETYKKAAHMWRITDDFWDQWSLLYDMFDRAQKWCIHTGAGHYPDADMLPVGMLRCNGSEQSWTHFTEDELTSMISLWCIFRAPLMIGGEMTSFDEFTLKLLTNPDILEMHKNGRHPHPVWRKEIGGIEHMLWTAQAKAGGQYAVIFNLGEEDSAISIRLNDPEIEHAGSVKELWSGREIAVENNSIPVKLPKHGAACYLIRE